MKNIGKNTRKLIRIFKLKKYIYPLIYFFDKINLLWLISPFLNIIMKFLKLNKYYGSSLPYKQYAKLFKNSLISNTNPKKRIVILDVQGVNTQETFVKMMIAKKFIDTNNKPDFLVCDSVLPLCDRERIFKMREGNFLFCNECYNGYKTIEKQTGLDIKYLSILMTNEIVNSLKSEEVNIESLNNIKECKNYKYQNIPFGKLTHNGMMRHFNTGNLNSDPETLNIYKKKLYSVFKFYLLFLEYIKRFGKPDLILIWNGVLSIGSVTIYLSKILNIDFITLENYVYKKNSFIYKKNGIAVHYQWHKDWQKLKSNIFYTPNQIEKSELFIKEILTGKSFGKNYNDKNYFQINTNERYVGLFTNLNFDTYVVGRNPIFESMNDWLVKTIDFWNDNVENFKLIIRPHPAEEKILIPVLEYVRDLVKPKLSEKILFLDSNENVNSYYILNHIEYGLVYSSTIGFEMILRNIPCMASGETYYDIFAIKPKNIKDYFKKIIDLNNKKFKITYDLDEIKKFVYFFYYTKVYEWQNVDFSGGVKIIEKNLQHLLKNNEKLLNDFYDYSIN